MNLIVNRLSMFKIDEVSSYSNNETQIIYVFVLIVDIIIVINMQLNIKISELYYP